MWCGVRGVQRAHRLHASLSILPIPAHQPTRYTRTIVNNIQLYAIGIDIDRKGIDFR